MKLCTKISVLIFIFLCTILFNSCSSKSSAQETDQIDQEGQTLETEKDIERVKKLYIEFNNLSELSISKNRFEPSEVRHLNLIIGKLNFYIKSYELKYQSLLMGEDLFMTLLHDSESHEIISKYILISSQMKKIEGSQYVEI